MDRRAVRRETCRFKELMTFVAYTRRSALVFSLKKNDPIEWTAASMSAIFPAYSCFEPAASWRSPLVTNRADLEQYFLVFRRSQWPWHWDSGWGQSGGMLEMERCLWDLQCGAKVSGHEGYDMAYIMRDILERSAESPPTMSINARGTCCSFGVQDSTSNGGSSDLVKYDWVYFRRVRISLW